MAVLEVGSGVRTSYGVNEVPSMWVSVEGCLQCGPVDYFGYQGQKINRYLDVNVGANEINGAVNAMF